MPVRKMVLGDVGLAVELINREGWGHTRIDLERILTLCPDINFIWESEGVSRGFVTSLKYGNTAVIGHLLVSKESRGRQIGKSLLRTILDELDSRGVRSTILLATEEGSRLYGKFGFSTTNELLSVGLLLTDSARKGLRQSCREVQGSDLADIQEMDSRAFGDDRSHLIQRLFLDFPEHCHVIEKEGRPAGFAFGRRTPIGFDIGPWVCESGERDDALRLLSSVMRSFPAGGRVDLSPFADNNASVGILSEFRQYKRAERVKMMVRGERRYVRDREYVFGVAGFELG